MAQAKAQIQGQVPAPAGQQAGALAPTGKAQDLTMEEAVAKALQLNIDLSVERLNPQLQDLVADGRQGGLRADGHVDASRSNNATSVPANIYQGGDKVTNQTYNWNFGGTQAVRQTGGTLSLTWNNSYLDSTNSANTINPKYDTSLRASFAQPLLAQPLDRQQPPEPADRRDQPAPRRHLAARRHGQHGREHAERLLGLRLCDPGGGIREDLAGPGPEAGRRQQGEGGDRDAGAARHRLGAGRGRDAPVVAGDRGSQQADGRTRAQAPDRRAGRATRSGACRSTRPTARRRTSPRRSTSSRPSARRSRTAPTSSRHGGTSRSATSA